MATCDEVRERLPDYLYELLPEWQAEEVSAHVRECAECEGARDELVEELRALEAWETPGPATDTSREFIRKLRVEESTALARRRQALGYGQGRRDTALVPSPNLIRRWQGLPRGARVAVASVSLAAVAALAILLFALPGQHSGVAQVEHPRLLEADAAAYQHALKLGRAGKYAEASDALRGVIASRPDHVGAHYALGCTLVELKDQEGAASSFRRVVELAPGTAEATEAQKALERLAN